MSILLLLFCSKSIHRLNTASSSSALEDGTRRIIVSNCDGPDNILITNSIFEHSRTEGFGSSIYINCFSTVLNIKGAFFNDCGLTRNGNGGAVYFQGLLCNIQRICGFDCFSSVGSFTYLITQRPKNNSNGELINNEFSAISESTVTKCPRVADQNFGYQAALVIEGGRIKFTNLNSSFNSLYYHGAGFMSRNCVESISSMFTLYNTSGVNSLDLFSDNSVPLGKTHFEYANIISNYMSGNAILIYTNCFDNYLKNIIFVNNVFKTGIYSFSAQRKIVFENCFSNTEFTLNNDASSNSVGKIEVVNPDGGSSLKTHKIQHIITQQCYGEIPLPTDVFTDNTQWKFNLFKNIAFLFSACLLE